MVPLSHQAPSSEHSYVSDFMEAAIPGAPGRHATSTLKEFSPSQPASGPLLSAGGGPGGGDPPEAVQAGLRAALDPGRRLLWGPLSTRASPAEWRKSSERDRAPTQEAVRESENKGDQGGSSCKYSS